MGEMIMYCTRCGKEIQNDSTFCPYCGSKVIRPYQENDPAQRNYYSNSTERFHPQDSGNIIWGVIGFFIPVVGLILWLVWKDERPLDAKVSGKGALISVIVQVGIAVLFFVLVMIFGIAGILAFS